MKFFLDENFPKSAIPLLEKQGHVIVDCRAEGLSGSDDAKLFEIAQNHEAVFLTTDRDFFNTVPHLFPNHFGIVVIALKQPNRTAIIQNLDLLMNKVEPEKYKGRAFQIRDGACNIYPPL